MKKTGHNMICLQCKSSFYTPGWALRKGRGKYCTMKCYQIAEKGRKPVNTGKFNLNTYYGLHNWVKHELGQPENCEQCGSNNTVEWANKSNQYKHDLSDWLRLCRKCHMRHDAKFGIRKRLYA